MNRLWRMTGRLVCGLVYVVASLPLCYALWLTLRMLVGDYFTIPTGSMYPTLQPGDKVWVNKLLMGARIYTDLHFDMDGGELHAFRLCGLRDLERGDVVVFNYPRHNNRVNFVINHVYCKRIVALPGDTISVENGYYVNNNSSLVPGLPEAQRRLGDMPDSLLGEWRRHLYPYDDHLQWTVKNLGPVYVPRRGDIVRLTAREGAIYEPFLEWELGTEITVDWERNVTLSDGRPLPRHTFRHDYCYAAGDYVKDSRDSRYWGFVPKDYIVGIVTRVLFSRDAEADTMRWERTLKDIYRKDQ